MKHCVSLLFFLFVIGNCFSQSLSDSEESSDSRIERKIGMSAQVMGPVGLGVAFDIFINPSINLEVSLAPFGDDFNGIGIGAKYHWSKPNPDRVWFPFIGVSYSAVEFVILREDFYKSVFIPVGVHYIAPKGVQVSIDISPAYINNTTDGREYISIWGTFEIGYRF